MKNFKILLFLIFLISTLAQGQTTPPVKLRSTGAFTQVDYFLNVKKRFGIPFSPINNLVCNNSYPLMFNTTEGKLKLFTGTSWINPFSLNLQEVTTFGNNTTNNIIVSTDSSPQRTIIGPGSLSLIKNSLTDIAVLRADNVTGGEKVFQFPNISGSLVTDAPSDGTSYIRKNGIWEANAGGASPTLQDVLTAGNTATSSIKLNNTSFNAISIGTQPFGNRLNINQSGILGYDANGYPVFIMNTGNGATSFKITDESTHTVFIDLDAYRQMIKVCDGIGNNPTGANSNYAGVATDGFVFHSSNGSTAKIKLSSPVVETFPALNEWVLPTKYGKIGILNTTAPASSTDTGVVGEIRVTSTYIYVCTATNTWVRSAVATW